MVIENLECRSNNFYHLTSQFSIISPPFACDFNVNVPDIVAISKEDGLVHILNLDKTSFENPMMEFTVHQNAIFDVKWVPLSSKILTASGDQTINLCDVNTRELLTHFHGHTQSVKRISINPCNFNVFASASRDGSIRIWDMRLKEEQMSLEGLHSQSVLKQCHMPTFQSSPALKRLHKQDSHSVTCVNYFDEYSLFSSGSTDCAIKLWDLRMFSKRQKHKLAPKMTMTYRGLSQKMLGYSDLVISSDKSRLFASCMDNCVYQYDLANLAPQRPSFLYNGHVVNSFYIRMDLSKDGSFLACGSGDGNAFIYEIDKPKQSPIVLPCTERTEVSVVQFSKIEPTRLLTLSENSEIRVWNAYPARRYMPSSDSVPIVAIASRSTAVKMSPLLQKTHLLVSPVRKLNSPVTTTTPINSRTTTSKLETALVSNAAVITPPPLSRSSPFLLSNRSNQIRQLNIPDLLEKRKFQIGESEANKENEIEFSPKTPGSLKRRSIIPTGRLKDNCKKRRTLFHSSAQKHSIETKNTVTKRESNVRSSLGGHSSITKYFQKLNSEADS
ncbi:hypothetical protein Ciccas_009041 [Cichlidogyrus casuarinus]|uniref:Denticleless protein homolog n=1 Tax=Cichlidogyrus casuarinus TaxID=1844966 RepID=A0ABD2PY64_9PLAT